MKDSQKIKIVAMNVIMSAELFKMSVFSLHEIMESVDMSKYRINIIVVPINELYLIDSHILKEIEKCNTFKKSVHVDFVIYENQFSITIETLLS